MEPIRLSTVTRFSGEKTNPHFEDLTEQFRGKSNGAFFAEVRKRLDQAGAEDPRFSHGGRAAIGLTGAYGMIGMGIRHAQRHIRFDRQPSYWSHTFLFYDPISADLAVNRSPTRSPWIWESTLEPAGVFSHYSDRNGVGPRRLADYDYARFDLFRPQCIPNVAVVAFGLKQEEADKVIDRADDPDVDRLRYDLVGLIGTWYAYITSQAEKPNPLANGQAIYCSAYVQLAYEAAEIDLALGAHQRNTSPEHIWQTARWFHRRYEELGHPIRLYACIRDPYGGLLPPKVSPPKGLRNLIKEFES
jgi:hypothetical protein